MSETAISRRRLLSLLSATSALALAGCGRGTHPDPAAPPRLQFLDTPFAAPTTHALLSDFQSRNPSVRIQRTEIPLRRLRTDLVTNLASGITQDLTFVPAGSLARLAARRWLRDLSALPGVADLNAAELPWAREQTTLNGRRYGALAWVRLHGFFYNRSYLAKIGASAPATFDELKTVAAAVERQHLGNFAFFWPFKNGSGPFAEDYLANGTPMFDSRLNPRFARDPLYRAVLEWRLHALYEWNLADPRGLSTERDDDESFPHGWAAFSWATYDQLRYWQTSGRYLQGGHLANALVPSRTTVHQAIGAADLYAIPVTARQDDNAWELVRYLSVADRYRAARLHWRESGLLSGYAPLVSDAALLDLGADWADTTVLRDQLAAVCPPPAISAPWRDEWLSDATIQSARLVRKEVSPADFIQLIARQWDSFRSGWTSGPAGNF